jgi:DNA excision repair protein ERCC-5
MSRFPDDAGEQIAENAVYLEELEGRPGPSVPRPPVTTASAARSEDVISDPAEERRKKFRKHDPYRLPEATIPTSSTADKPDARLATEEELKQFIDEMHPSDIDIESAEFRALPTEVQYEIIGDMRIRSRQQSHKRLVDMLRTAPTALDFSKAQIKHLSQRNALTQQLLTVTDMVGSAHLTIPVRIAAERNREYVLVKRGEDAGGGWALGIREGTKANPIRLEPDDEKPQRSGSSSDNESEYSETMESDSDIEEVPPPPSTTATVDQDLREHRRREILEAITARYAPKQPSRAPLDLPVQPFGSAPAPGAAPLFTASGEDDEGEEEVIVPTANDEALALALQQEELGSDEDVPDEELVRALALSRRDAAAGRNRASPGSGSGSAGGFPAAEVEALSEGASVRELEPVEHDSDDSIEEMEEVELVPSGRSTPMSLSQAAVGEEEDEEGDFVQVVEIARPISAKTQQQQVSPEQVSESASQTIPRTLDSRLEASRPGAPAAPAESAHETLLRPDPASPTVSRDHTPSRSSAAGDSTQPIVIDDDEEEEAEIVPVVPPQPPIATVASPIAAPVVVTQPRRPLLPHRPSVPSPLASRPTSPAPPHVAPLSPSPPSPPRPPLGLVEHEPERMIDEALASGSRSRSATGTPFSERRFTDDDDSAYRVPTDDEDEDGHEHEHEEEEDDDEEERLEWSRSPSPIHRRRPPLAAEISVDSVPSEVENEVEEDEGEMAPDDMVAEEDDYARFMAQIKNRDLNEVRTEIDDEIRVLNSANKVAMRDSDEITQAMIAQIQSLLRHIGIPYITAPMEAEAQCAKLAELGLVDGIITDDSDVFLFGGIQCFKNIFNDAKYAECFVLADIERELSLTRERLVSLAYLLGSDYTIGLPGVGPVVALELLANFPGPKGIDDFKNWWTKVQRGQDLPVEADTKWKRNFVSGIPP